MTAIRANCTCCNAEVQLIQEDIIIHVWADKDERFYHFSCPACHQLSSKQTSVRISDMLTGIGVKIETLSTPKEMLEPHHGSTITHDDVLDFHSALEDDERFKAAINGLSAEA